MRVKWRQVYLVTVLVGVCIGDENKRQKREGDDGHLIKLLEIFKIYIYIPGNEYQSLRK